MRWSAAERSAGALTSGPCQTFMAYGSNGPHRILEASARQHLKRGSASSAIASSELPYSYTEKPDSGGANLDENGDIPSVPAPFRSRIGLRQRRLRRVPECPNRGHPRRLRHNAPSRLAGGVVKKEQFTRSGHLGQHLGRFGYTVRALAGVAAPPTISSWSVR